jgi:hypothetical protein
MVEFFALFIVDEFQLFEFISFVSVHLTKLTILWVNGKYHAHAVMHLCSCVVQVLSLCKHNLLLLHLAAFYVAV